MLHDDVFHHLIRPRLAMRLEDWDNGANVEVPFEASQSFDDCRSLCEADQNCVQFRFWPGKCRLSSSVKLGNVTLPQYAITSGWLLDRVDSMAAERHCDSGSTE